MDQQLHLLDRQRVLDLAEMGCALARCGVLLLIPEVALHPAGQPCLARLLSSRCGALNGCPDVGEAERDGAAGDRGGLPAVPTHRSERSMVADADAVGGDEVAWVDPVLPVVDRFRDHPRGSLVCPARGRRSWWPVGRLAAG